MQLDIRLPIGLLFVVLGTLLAGYGLFTREYPSGPGADLNWDAGWGGILLLFGVTMLALSFRGRRRRDVP
jgi:hypothetical protein